METLHRVKRIGVLTSGGDSQGMNAAVRAVVRAGLNAGAAVYAIDEGYQGMVDGGANIHPLSWFDVGGILQQGGTIIGSARSADFRTREGRLKAVANLLANGIDALVVIGGDGSLTGANLFRQEWPELLAELLAKGAIPQEIADAHPHLTLVGLVGSIDNDMFGTDMTIGADTALHRIVEAADAIVSTAASHQRSFVVEVMGRHAGYLALMSGLATGADWVFIPESPPDDGWEAVMCATIQAGRARGRRHNMIIVAEGAIDCSGQPITSDYVKQVLTERLGEDTRVTLLGHVQRGGTPSAFDRNMSTMLGAAAVAHLLAASPDQTPQLFGMRDNEVIHSPLMENVRKTQEVAERIRAGDYEQAMAMRGRGFVESYAILRTLVQAQPHPAPEDQRALRLAVMHMGGPAPGMNTAVRAAVRLGLDRGHTMLAVRDGLNGLLAGQVTEMQWMSVHGWVARGGAELGTSRRLPTEEEYARIAEQLREHRIDGLLIIGGWVGYQFAYQLASRRHEHAPFGVPIVCVPATINNDLPGTEITIGADTALNTIVADVDKIKESAVASQRCYVVEVMGRDCGYLALLSGLATGAERVYLPEEGISLADLQDDVAAMSEGFARGKRLGLIIRSEQADPFYTTAFLATLFEKEGGKLFDVRQTILGHTQQGGKPSPFDRIQASRLAGMALSQLIELAQRGERAALCIGRQTGQIHFTDLSDLPALIEPYARRPKVQRWLKNRSLADAMAQYRPPQREKRSQG
ncbi:MAG TPA: 6-phosphofructokinase [Roseiflexaceae bacterium]|nr:6-phosphofructokinase [Roseiflexaceae bacterium]